MLKLKISIGWFLRPFICDHWPSSSFPKRMLTAKIWSRVDFSNLEYPRSRACAHVNVVVVDVVVAYHSLQNTCSEATRRTQLRKSWT